LNESSEQSSTIYKGDTFMRDKSRNIQGSDQKQFSSDRFVKSNDMNRQGN